MFVSHLALTDFRSYTEVDVPLKPGVTIFSGPNGEGKTNLVEAVGYAATLASHRAAQDAPLIRKGTDQAIIRAAISTTPNDALVEIELNVGRANRVRLNKTPLNRPRDVLGVLRTVLFAPEDLALVGHDDVALAGWDCHAITSIASPGDAREAAFIELIEADPGAAPRQTTLTTAVSWRRSTGPLPERRA